LERVKAVKEVWTIATGGQFMKMKQIMSRKTGEKNSATRLMKQHCVAKWNVLRAVR
jgi:hypothetical protein